MIGKDDYRRRDEKSAGQDDLGVAPAQREGPDLKGPRRGEQRELDVDDPPACEERREQVRGHEDDQQQSVPAGRPLLFRLAGQIASSSMRPQAPPHHAARRGLVWAAGFESGVAI